jgi:hypothetical protein
LTASAKTHPEDQKHQAATRDLFWAVSSVLEASLSHGPEEAVETNSSQVVDPGQTQISCPLYVQLTPAFLGDLSPHLTDKAAEAQKIKYFPRNRKKGFREQNP